MNAKKPQRLWGRGFICTPPIDKKAILHFSYDKEKNKRRREERNTKIINRKAKLKDEGDNSYCLSCYFVHLLLSLY